MTDTWLTPWRGVTCKAWQCKWKCDVQADRDTKTCPNHCIMIRVLVLTVCMKAAVRYQKSFRKNNRRHHNKHGVGIDSKHTSISVINPSAALIPWHHQVTGCTGTHQIMWMTSLWISTHVVSIVLVHITRRYGHQELLACGSSPIQTWLGKMPNLNKIQKPLSSNPDAWHVSVRPWGNGIQEQIQELLAQQKHLTSRQHFDHTGHLQPVRGHLTWCCTQAHREAH